MNRDRVAIRAGSGTVSPPSPPPHRCELPDPAVFPVGSVFDCDCGNRSVLIETPDRPEDRWDIGKRWQSFGRLVRG